MSSRTTTRITAGTAHLLPAGFLVQPAYLPAARSDALLATMLGARWDSPSWYRAGKSGPLPRLTRWYGDSPYVYSGIVNQPTPWLPVLKDLRDEMASFTAVSYNSVLANLYRSGADKVAAHRDDEPGLGPAPVIASLSLGATRDFVIRHQPTGQRWIVPLGHGDLLVMRGNSQSDFSHELPRRAGVTSSRVNLTYRHFLEPSRGR